tara:strand:+ start:512 stop:865 length:354 start_codon:yes stop_codon:yes gene_type:complete
MMTMLDKPILEFVENEVDFHRLEMVHGTLYAKLKNDTDCGILHEKLEKFYRKNINPAGAVNMYFVGDEFAFDFVPEDAKQDKGVWSEFAEEGLGLTDKELSDVDTMLQLENEMEMGK